MIATTPGLVETEQFSPRQLETEVTAFRHRLAETGLFTDESLVRLIDSHPREFCNVSAMGHDRCKYEWGEGDTTGLNGEQLLQALQTGRLWLNIRRLERFQPELWSVVEELYASLEEKCPDFQTTKRSGNLLISSPTAFVYYHLDVPQNILWHIRGRKRVWVYPVEERFVASDVLEETVAGQRVEDLPYRPELDDGAQVFDMEPGDVVTWPQNSPHRVDNVEGLNVSLSTEHYTAAQLRYVRVCRANQLLKRAFNIPCRSKKTRGFAYALKSTAFLGCRTLQKVFRRKEPYMEYPQTFRVDLNEPDCIRPLQSGNN